MADLNVALILRLVDRATGPARSAMRALERIGGQGIVAQADRAARASRMIGDGMGRVARSTAVAGTAVAAYTGILTGIGAAFVRPAAQFERFNVQLTNLEGSAGGAKRAMSWIEDFATRTPLELEDTVAAYAKLKAFGIDPTNGSLQAMVDTMAAAGGDVETMNGLVLAFGQAWTKGKLQGEEAMQMLERGVPVWDILAKAMGKTTAEVMDMSSKGKLGREQIQLLMDELGKRNAGASEEMSKTWDGITSNLTDHWKRFQRMVMDAGLFDFMKGRLQDLLNLLNAAAADGRLQAWATTVAENILWAMKSLYEFGVWLYQTWTAVWPVLDRVAQAIGGWDVVAWAAGFVFFSSTIVSTLTGLKMVVGGLALLARALLANPIIAVISLIAGLAYVIYQNWDGIVGYFTDKIDRIRTAFDDGLLNGVLQYISEFNPFKLMIDGIIGLTEYLTGWDLSGVKSHLYDAFGINLFDSGVQMIQSLWQGLKAKIGEMKTWLLTQVQEAIPSWMRSGIGAAGVDAGPSGSSTTGEVFDFGGGAEGGRATGGPVRRGQTYNVGENGVERFTADRDGWIIPNRHVAGAGRGGGGTSINLGGITINAAPGMSPQMIARAVSDEIERRARDARFALNDGGGYA